MNAETIISRVKKPTEAEAKVLASYFPSTSAPRKREYPRFDPSAQSIVLPMQKKKKAAITKRERPSNITVVMMKEYCTSIPKGKVRQKLAAKGRILSVRFSRSMSCQEVTNQIIRTFKVAKFVLLECDSTGHNLIRCADQSLDGEKTVDRKGALYLCESFNPQKVLPTLTVNKCIYYTLIIDLHCMGGINLMHLLCMYKISITLVLYNGLIRPRKSLSGCVA